MILAVQLSHTVTEAKFLAENLTATNIKIFILSIDVIRILAANKYKIRLGADDVINKFDCSTVTL